jgi:hypothetical protein
METAQQMDSALQRRSKSKNQTTGGSASSSSSQMTDSEKIALQMLLDGQAFGDHIREVCPALDRDELLSYSSLMREISEAKRLIESK